MFDSGANFNFVFSVESLEVDGESSILISFIPFIVV